MEAWLTSKGRKGKDTLENFVVNQNSKWKVTDYAKYVPKEYLIQDIENYIEPQSLTSGQVLDVI